MENKPNPVSAPSPFLTREELRERWHCSKRFIQTFRDIPSTKLGRTVLFHLNDVLAYEKRKSHESDASADNAPEPAAEAGINMESLTKELVNIRSSLETLENARLHHNALFQQVIRQMEGFRAAIGELGNALTEGAGTSGTNQGLQPLTPSSAMLEQTESGDDPGAESAEQEAMMGAFLHFINNIPPDKGKTF